MNLIDIKPEVGLVIRYAFLWPHERDQGRIEAAKDRPCIIVSCRTTAYGIRIVVVPITRSEPGREAPMSALPNATRQRLGLDADMSWALCDAVNTFIWPGFDLRKTSNGRWAYGFVPPTLSQMIALELLKQPVLSIDREESDG